MKIEEGDGLVSYEGNLGVDLGQRKEVQAEWRGSLNDTSLTLVLDANYKIFEGARNPETIRWKSTISKFKHEEESTQIDTTLNLDFSEFPDYNLGASWKYQVSILSSFFLFRVHNNTIALASASVLVLSLASAGISTTL